MLPFPGRTFDEKPASLAALYLQGRLARAGGSPSHLCLLCPNTVNQVDDCPLLRSPEQEEEELEEFLCPVQTPPGLVGVEAALQPAPAMPLALQNISLKHLGTEIQ